MDPNNPKQNSADNEVEPQTLGEQNTQGDQVQSPESSVNQPQTILPENDQLGSAQTMQPQPQTIQPNNVPVAGQTVQPEISNMQQSPIASENPSQTPPGDQNIQVSSANQPQSPTIPQAPPEVQATASAQQANPNANVMSPLGAPKKANPSNKKLITMIVAVIVGLAVIAGGAFVALGMLSNDDSIAVADLVLEEKEEVSFKRPKQWLPTEEAGVQYAYANEAVNEQGEKTGEAAKLDESQEFLVILVDSLGFGVNIDNAPEDRIDEVRQSFKEQFASEESLEDLDLEGCDAVSNLRSDEVETQDYTLLFSVEAQCDSNTPDKLSGQIKMRIGFKGENLLIFAVVATNERWESSGPAFDEVLSSVKPIES